MTPEELLNAHEEHNNIEFACDECLQDKLNQYQDDPRPDYKIGDFVKAQFQTGGEDNYEWMWVKITHVLENSIAGTLDNDPLNATPDLQYGDAVTVNFSEISEYLPGE